MTGPVTMDPLLDVTLRAALAAMLVWAAVHKLRDLRAFVSVIRGYEILPAGAARWFAPGFAALELLLAVALLWSPAQRIAGFALAALLASYTAAIHVNLRRGRRVDCGCFGPARRQPLSEWLLLRNALLVGAAVVAGLPAGDRPLGAFDVFLAGVAVTTLALLWIATNQLLAQWPALAALRRRA